MRRHVWVVLFLAAWLPAQGRTEVWDHIKKTYDKDGDGKVTFTEYTRGKRGFENLDKDRDGVLTSDDFGRRTGGRNNRARPESKVSDTARQIGDMFGSFINTDGQPGISKTDWAGLIKTLKPGEDGVVPKDHFSFVMGKAGQGRMGGFANGRLSRLLDSDGDKKVTVDEINAAFKKMDSDGDGTIEVESEIIMPPGVGEKAPDFTLPFAGAPKKTLTLSSFQGKKPVCLIFGSYT